MKLSVNMKSCEELHHHHHHVLLPNESMNELHDLIEHSILLLPHPVILPPPPSSFCRFNVLKSFPTGALQLHKKLNPPLKTSAHRLDPNVYDRP